MVVCAFGYVVMLVLAWLLSSNRAVIQWRVVIGGTALQFVLALLLLKTTAGRAAFEKLGALFESAINSTDAGCLLVFGKNFNDHFVAFKVLPIIIVFSALTAALYHVGVMGRLVAAMGWLMQRTLGTSGAESLVAAANIFVGNTSAPLVARPYLERMTQSEIMCIMVSGFATIAGSVMAAYIGMGIPAVHLLVASVISAPAALVVAKLIQPEVEVPVTGAQPAEPPPQKPEPAAATETPAIPAPSANGAPPPVPPAPQVPPQPANLIHAIAMGTTEGLQLALSVGAMLIAFIALLAMANGVVGWGGDLAMAWLGGVQVFDAAGKRLVDPVTLEGLCAYAFLPFAWLMGIDSKDCWRSSELLGLRFVANEFLAYDRLGNWMKPGSGVEMSPRSIAILTYAMCGFANLGSIGVQIGGLAPVMPSREGDLARLAFRAMLGGTLASFMTACIAGMLL